MNFVFLSPHFPPNFYRFAARLKQHGVTVLGLADESYDALRPELKGALTEYFRVNDMHNYDELGVTCRHRPFGVDDPDPWLKAFYKELHELLKSNTKVLVHGEEVGDRIVGIMGGYIRWAGLVDDDTQAITVTERLAGRQLDPFARNVILLAPKLR